MTETQAKAELRKKGVVKFRGVTISETKEMKGNWQQYTGRYVVFVDGMRINDDSVSMAKAFQIAKPYFR